MMLGSSGEWQKIDNTTVLSGAGTGDYLARWTDTETLGDSVLLASGSDILMPQYLIHTGDTDTYFGFSAANTYKVHTGGSDRFSIGGDVAVLGTTDFSIPAGRKFYLDGQSNTYITESSDGVIDFYGDGTFLVSMKQNGTQSEVVVNEGSGDVDFRVEANNEDHAFFVDAEASGAVAVGGSNITYKFNVHEGDMFVGATSAVGGRGIYFQRTSATNAWSLLQGHNGTNAFELREGSDTRMFWENGGDVGIGTITPGEKLHVSTANNTVAKFESTDANANIRVGDTVDNAHLGTDGGKTYIGPDTAVGGNNITILSGGDVGIGTASPDTKLHVWEASAGTVTAGIRCPISG